MNACMFILLPKGEKCGVAMLSREKIRQKGQINRDFFVESKFYTIFAT